MKSVFDEGEYENLALPEVPADPLKFRDSKKYRDRCVTLPGQSFVSLDTLTVINCERDEHRDHQNSHDGDFVRSRHER